MKKNNELPENLFIILSGPTGTGKSAIALELAKTIPAEIINADSRQFYREINVGTAKPSLEAFQQVPHHLYSFLSLKDDFSVFDFRKILEKLVPQIWKRKKAAILVGGSGLYIRVLLKGIFDFPEEKKEDQKEIRKILLKEKTENLYKKLKQVDPEATEKIHPNDKIRIVRALEVWLITGIPMSQWQQQAEPADFIKRAQVRYWILNMERDKLYHILDMRTEKMLEGGWLEEVKRIVEDGLKDYLKEKAPIGYIELCDFLDGKMDWNKTIETIKKKTKNYARRQLTWFRKEKEAHWIDVTSMGHKAAAEFLAKKLMPE
ncbi:MAG: tRNA (adenosine(37)-N6)-dimethylallyltransferase MiaA [Candidatus Omnitrophica bacterium]|nr:tRNA (adenosine(37)-N6)-dimethylallyltransferase MiaA [Candidatus Omnitrophota bacterium]MCM8816013.1 tRNA (adenosine(37)-N6)-dimethylallyltransferase MiaA [Candidatus Omnitrophota bacterium]